MLDVPLSAPTPPRGADPETLKERRLAANRRRAATLDKAKDGHLTFQGLLVLAQVDNAIGKIRVDRAIKAFPGIGAKKCGALLNEGTIAPKTTLRAISRWGTKKDWLIARVDKGKARPETSTQFPFQRLDGDPVVAA